MLRPISPVGSSTRNRTSSTSSRGQGGANHPGFHRNEPRLLPLRTGGCNWKSGAGPGWGRSKDCHQPLDPMPAVCGFPVGFPKTARPVGWGRVHRQAADTSKTPRNRRARSRRFHQGGVGAIANPTDIGRPHATAAPVSANFGTFFGGTRRAAPDRTGERVLCRRGPRQ